MSDDYRARALQYLNDARTEMDSGEPKRLPFAALRLRMALEALTYERAHVYREWLAPEQCEAWQPKRVMETLLAIDPNADKGGTLAIGLEEVYGESAKEMTQVGTEHVLSLSTIKQHYDALGSFLHMPTIKQLRKSAGQDMEKLRRRCNEVAEAIQKVLSSSIFNMTASFTVDFDCDRCRVRNARRVPWASYHFETWCSACRAPYVIAGTMEGGTVTPQAKSWSCCTEGCKGRAPLWPDEVKQGATWQCPECGVGHVLKLVCRPARTEPAT
jgi:hypothetical protein